MQMVLIFATDDKGGKCCVQGLETPGVHIMCDCFELRPFEEVVASQLLLAHTRRPLYILCHNRHLQVLLALLSHSLSLFSIRSKGCTNPAQSLLGDDSGVLPLFGARDTIPVALAQPCCLHHAFTPENKESPPPISMITRNAFLVLCCMHADIGRKANIHSALALTVHF
jgi:hypothetical protein